MKRLSKTIVAITIAVMISVASACIASSATKKSFDPERMKVWVEGKFVYLETLDGNVWVHEVE